MIARRILVGLVLVALVWAAWTADRAPRPDRSASSARADEAAALYDAGRHAEAADAYLEAAAAAERAEAPDLARAWRAQAGVCFKMAGELARARAQLEPVIEEARAAGDDQSLGLALGNLARVAGLQGDLAEARAHQDALAELAARLGDGVLEVKTLEQAADTSLRLDDLAGAAERLQRARDLDAANPEEERRADALTRQIAWVRARARDDEGAAAEWRAVPPSAAALANQSRHLTELGLHPEAVEAARAAVRMFEEEGEARRAERDRALLLEAGALLRAGELRAGRVLVDGVLAGGGDAVALAPFRIQGARQAMALEEWNEALRLMDEAAPSSDAIEDGRVLPWLRAAALILARRHDEARGVLVHAADSETFDLPTALLLAWSLGDAPPGDGAEGAALVARVIASLTPDPERPLDPAVALLRELCPPGLPSLAFATLDLHVAEASRRRDAGDEGAAAALVTGGVRHALLWQAMELLDLVSPGAPAVSGPDDAAGRARLDAWVAGDLAPDRAVGAVIPGDLRSYLVLCTSDLGATTLGLPPRFVLRQSMGAVVEALHGDDDGRLAEESHRLFRWIFNDRARDDLAGRTHWTLILPDDLTPVPPALWLPDLPAPGEPPTWLVLTHVVGLLPHALAGAPVPAGEAIPSGDGGPSGDEASSSNEAADEWQTWAQIATPEIDLASMPLSSGWLAARYGESALRPRSVARATRGPDWGGPQANAATLRRAHETVDVLQLAVPGLGGGRLGGLYLSPLPESQRRATTPTDEALGFLPWHRLAEIDLPPALVLDQTRFDPGDDRHGAAYAAAAMMRSSRSVLLTRWPASRPAADIVLELFGRAVRSGIPCGPALAAAQRACILQGRMDGTAGDLGPRAWGPWLAFSAD